MISQIKNLTYKSFLDYTGPAENFKSKNIIYGDNGNGKSSLAIGLYNSFIQSDHERLTYLFNKYYIAQNMLLTEESNDNIKAVKITYGDKNVSNEKEIKELKDKLDILKSNESGLKKKIDGHSKKVLSEIEKIFQDNKKDNKSIKRKPGKDVDRKFNAWCGEYTEAIKQHPDYDYSNSPTSKKIEEEINDIEKAKINELNCSEIDQLLRVIESLMMTGYPELGISNEVLNWINEGLHIHNDKKKDVCEFCHNKFDRNQLLGEINDKLKNETAKKQKYLETATDKLILFKDQLGTLNVNSKVLLENGDFNDTYFTLVSLINIAREELESNILTMQAKIKKMATPLNKKLLSQVKINDIEQLINDLIKKKRKISREKSRELEEINTLIKGVIGFKIKNSTLISSEMALLKQDNKNLSEMSENANDIEQQIESLEAEGSDISDFAQEINEILTDYEVGLKLVPKNDTYFLCHKFNPEREITLDVISEGERNVLAFCYFYCSLLGTEKEIKNDIAGIIIDDPISSLDNKNSTLITAMLEHILKSNAQVFILTHSWKDYLNIIYSKQEEEYGFYECFKENYRSSIRRIKKSVSVYKKLYQEIYQIQKKNFDDIKPEEFLHLPNTMRRVFESYLRFNFNISMATANSIDKIKTVFEFSNRDIDNGKLQGFLNVINVFSHGSIFEYNPKQREIYDSAKFLIKTLKCNNKGHHQKMIEDI
ncbi:AAA family ATPase [Sporolactobacillus laevolacticus]|uniref:Nuclease SbcCD subunit C n=1 Tax=Sporolactobacillus laevolacticus DSM 442 TaxID=1395513 RepID=V6J3H1_9BACL|nr:AAA family ATPase [Sporolactobacillus laevolacticus]EST13706.1 hypothetical protein P343_01755 [Sporolactobacillus laevolacticus DSM 442]